MAPPSLAVGVGGVPWDPKRRGLRSNDIAASVRDPGLFPLKPAARKQMGTPRPRNALEFSSRAWIHPKNGNRPLRGQDHCVASCEFVLWVRVSVVTLERPRVVYGSDGKASNQKTTRSGPKLEMVPPFLLDARRSAPCQTGVVCAQMVPDGCGSRAQSCTVSTGTSILDSSPQFVTDKEASMDLGSGEGLHSPGAVRLSENTVRRQKTLPDRATRAGRLRCKYESNRFIP